MVSGFSFQNGRRNLDHHFLSPKDSKGTTDFLAGITLGGEYFIHPQFSFGIEAQLNATFSDNSSYRFNNPGGTNLNTATAILANIYFD